MQISEKEYIEHFGVRGMKWGVRKRNSEGKTGRQLNKETRKGDKEKYKQGIDTARNYIKSGDAKAHKKRDKAEYKKNKVELGSVKAKQIYNSQKALTGALKASALQPKNIREATILSVSRQLTGPIGEMAYLKAIGA